MAEENSITFHKETVSQKINTDQTQKVWSALTNPEKNEDITDLCSGESAIAKSLLFEFGFLFLNLGYERDAGLKHGLLRLQDENGPESTPPKVPHVLFCLNRILRCSPFQQRFFPVELPQSKSGATFGSNSNSASSYPSSSTRNVRNQLRDDLRRIFRNMASLIHRSSNTNSSAPGADTYEIQVDGSPVDDKRDSEPTVRDEAAGSTHTRSSRRRSSRRLRKPPKRYGEWATKR